MTNESDDLWEPPMKDIWFYGRCLRVFWRGWRHPRPYCFHRWGFYAFGVLCIGFMFWPKEGAR